MKTFRTVKVSDPLYERDHLRFVTVKSPALGGRGDITLFVPPNCTHSKNLPLVILLHGVYGSHWSWTHAGGAHVTALEMIEKGAINPLILAMPSDGLWGDGSAYIPHVHADYERWIVEDVPDCVREVVPQIGTESKLCISGLSMGGYGALRLGAKYAQRFAAISAHSSLTHLKTLVQFVEEPLDRYGPMKDEEYSAAHWILKQREHLPRLRFDCGREDALLAENRALHAALESANIAHQYEEFPGGHQWEYWREHLRETLRFFDGV